MTEQRVSQPFTTLISAQDLWRRSRDPEWAILDCRFDLDKPEIGEAAYLQNHIPGAVYVHLERDLSAEPTGRNGRHPLPGTRQLTQTFSRLGIRAGVQVVAYDDDGGAYASRIWWSLRYLGHEAVAVLDGGFSAWRSDGLPLHTGREVRPPVQFVPIERSSMLIEVSEIAEGLDTWRLRLVDARAPERYHGENEPIDPVAGRIPGAVNRYWKDNLDEAGRFLPPAELRQQFESLLGSVPPDRVIHYCGSGVSACHNLLAMNHAGIQGPRLYVGSWSEWSADPNRPFVTGAEPHRDPQASQSP